VVLLVGNATRKGTIVGNGRPKDQVEQLIG
jgi:hypothetical protein